jgi:hypothetical protein
MMNLMKMIVFSGTALIGVSLTPRLPSLALAATASASTPQMVVPASLAEAADGDDADSKTIADAIKLGKVVWDVVGKPLMSAFSEHRRITPVKEKTGERDYFVMYVPMIKDGKTRASLNWDKHVFKNHRGKVRIELVNVPEESERAKVWVQGKGDKQAREDQNREDVFNLKAPVELDWGPGHSKDRSFYFAQRNGFDAGDFLKRHPAAAYKITVLTPLP